MSNPIRSRIPAFAVVVIVASVGTACSSSSSTADTITAPSSSAVSATTEAVATTTTATTEAPTSSTTVEDAIRAAHTRVMTELFARDERVTGPEAILPLAEELTTGPLLNRIQDSAAERGRTGERSVGPGYDSHIVAVTLTSGTSAAVLDCSLGQTEGYSSQGQLIAPADEHYRLRETEMVLVDDRWLAQELRVGGDQRCDPNS